MKRYFLLVAGLVLVLLSVLSCDRKPVNSTKYQLYESIIDNGKPLAFGDNRDIYVFCDEANWKALEQMLTQTMEQKVQLVESERYFSLHRANIKDIENLIKYKNLLFIGDLKTKGAVSRHVATTMPAAMVQKVKTSGGEMMTSSNRWVKDQLVIYLAGNDLDGLKKIADLQKGKLYDMFVQRFSQRLAYQAYQTKLVPEDFFAAYPFSLKIPENYKIFSTDKLNRFVSLLYRNPSQSKDFPDKYISIYYEDMPAENLTQSWLLQKRKELAWKYYDQDEFDQNKADPQQITFGKYPALQIRGAWKNTKHYIGGAFQTFAFYDTVQNRAYLIDNSVYFPAGDKLPELLELRMISESFVCNAGHTAHSGKQNKTKGNK
jgi:hypothetical protein